MAAVPVTVENPEEVLEQRERQVRVRRVLAGLKRRAGDVAAIAERRVQLGGGSLHFIFESEFGGTFLARADAAFRKEYVSRYGER